MLRRPDEGDDQLRGIIAASMSRYADKHLGMTPEGSEFRGRSIDFMQRWGFPNIWVEQQAEAIDWIVADSNTWIEGLLNG